MGKVNRLTASVALTALAAIVLVPAAAAASPTPSPSLSTMLVAPDGSFTESTDPTLDGATTAEDYAGTDSLVLEELKRDGWAGGYTRTWESQDGKHVVREQVVAFAGHRAAVSWLGTFKTLSASQYLVRPITLDGVDSFFGAHYAEPAQPLYIDVGAFPKGNDFFTISAGSKADDLGDLTSKQSKRQFDAAPAYSISPNQWPENSVRGPFNFSAAVLPVAIGGGAFLVVLILASLIVVVAVTRRRQPQLAPVGATEPAAAEGPLMSQDGSYWWDGQAWRDAAKEVPPDALRSADGYYWWDSRTWRPVPPST